MMNEEANREARFVSVRAAEHSGLTALTVLRARRYLDEFPDDDALNYFVWYWLGKALAVLSRHAEAEEALANALRLCPEGKLRIPLCGMGQLMEVRGEYEQAAGWYRKAIEAEPSDSAGYIYLGNILTRQGRLREAEEVYRAATESCYEGCLEEDFLNLGHTLRAQERFDEAAECFREAIRLDPDYRLARKALRDVERCLRFVRRRP
jgi:tetratricopeptide (TPR) repeat protein